MHQLVELRLVSTRSKPWNCAQQRLLHSMCRSPDAAATSSSIFAFRLTMTKHELKVLHVQTKGTTCGMQGG